MSVLIGMVAGIGGFVIGMQLAFWFATFLVKQSNDIGHSYGDYRDFDAKIEIVKKSNE